LSAAAKLSKPALSIIGLPYDASSSYRRGSRWGPSEIRSASQSIESYSPYLRRDLEDAAFFDEGDLEIVSLDSEAMLNAVAAYCKKRVEEGRRICALGGDHSVTVGIIRGLAEAGVNPCVLYLDAHFDLRDEYEGDRWSHACTAKRISEIVGFDHLIQWGIRSGERWEFESAENHDTYFGTDIDALCTICNRLRDYPIYLTLDLDLFDPSELPGTGNPEPCGLRFKEFLRILNDIEPLQIVGFDVVELSPLWDPSGRSSVTAAEIVRELILTTTR
jgi:agmatinase